MYDIAAIQNYILYLKEKCGLSVTLHPIRSNLVLSSPELSVFNFHDNSFCIFLKSCARAYNHCIERQGKVMKKCENGSYIGTCYAGVREFIYPIYGADGIAGFISISGYKTEGSSSYLDLVSDKYCIPIKDLERAYVSLKDRLPPKKEVDTLVMPLCDMLELASVKQSVKPGAVEHSFAGRVVAYIKRYHTQRISVQEVCRQFSCSRSYLSKEFSQHFGKSFRAYLNDLRIEDAKSLLRYSSLSVTEIAYSVGYSDSNYFSSLFKKMTGVSPLCYRNSKKPDEKADGNL